MVSKNALERLLAGTEPAEPHGRRGVGNEGTEKSRPTGWTLKKGSATGQELQFPNGYTVLALQVEGQKSVIKGPRAWLGMLKAVESGDLQAIVNPWLERISQGMEMLHPEEVIHEVSKESAPALEAKVDALAEQVAKLIELQVTKDQPRN